MPQSTEAQDPAAERLVALHVLLIELTQALCDAEIVRNRLLKAREANVWPTIPPFVSFAAKAPIEPN
jgi:hypothetical protein